MAAQVPVIVIAGFLGAGKTTLVNALLADPAGARLGVIVNDFGDVSIDALLVAGSIDGATSLGNGCMCCSADAESLTEVLANLVAPQRQLDAVVIEASGLAEPAALIRMILTIDDRRVGYGGLLYVADVNGVTELRAENPEVDRHIRAADLVVLNKADRASPDLIDAMCAGLADLNPRAAVVATSHGRIDARMLVDVPERANTQPRQLELADILADDAVGHHGEHSHMHHRFQSVSVTTLHRMHPRRLAALLERPPAGVYRIKGVLAIGDRRYVVHAVGGTVSVAPYRQRGVGGDVVIIGAGIDEDQVRSAVNSCIVADGEVVDEQSLVALTRYLD